VPDGGHNGEVTTVTPPDPTGSTRSDDPTEATCPCGKVVTVHWRRGSGFLGQASVICGVLIVAFGAFAATIGIRPLAGAVILGVLAAAIVVSIVVQFATGHRGTCALARGAWIGLAVPGLPLRVVLSFAI
jgi:hypothetical protein